MPYKLVSPKWLKKLMAFRDLCPECLSMTFPSLYEQVKHGHMRFGYMCRNGHDWYCSFVTFVELEDE